MCVDYRMLNKRSVKDAYALPRIEEVFDVLHGAKYFSTIDMKAGYHQVEIEDHHKERTAFTVGPLGFYEYIKMPFGLSNSPATYQRLMEEVLGDYNMTICVIYLDDLIIFSSSFEEHLRHLDMVLTRLRENNLKLSPKKCYFIQERVNFLGHVVSSQGIETDPAKIEKILNWPTPSNAKELRSFIAFAGYYHRFVKDFSKITRPLSELIPGTSKKKKKITKEWVWKDEQQKVFDNLKKIMTQPPVLAYPDFSKEFELHTDASTIGLGAVLYQDGKVIAYASRALTKSEKNYSAFKLEFLALKWAITEKFKDYLALQHFTVFTDSNPLTYVLTSAKLDATGHRWASALGEYNFDIEYRAGKKNIDADAMSRFPHSNFQEKESTQHIDNSTIKAICSSTSNLYTDVLPACNINIVEVTEEPGVPLAQIEYMEIRRQQRADPFIEKWRRTVIDKYKPTVEQCYFKGDLAMRKHFDCLKIKRGILYKEWKRKGMESIFQLVLPKCYKDQVLRGLHDDIGHPGRDRTTSLLKERYFWPGMTSDVEKWVSKCDRCLRRKANTTTSELVNIVSTYPLELVSMDFLTLEPSKGYGNVLVITDHFTKYAVAIPTNNQTAKTTASAFYNEFIVKYSIPTKLHTDQGTNFESDLMKELCNIVGVKKTRTSPYHPTGNGCTERWNRTLLNMLGTLDPDQKSNWKDYVTSLTYPYNCTRHESTNYSQI